jgi:hypothetical protein
VTTMEGPPTHVTSHDAAVVGGVTAFCSSLMPQSARSEFGGQHGSASPMIVFHTPMTAAFEDIYPYWAPVNAVTNRLCPWEEDDRAYSAKECSILGGFTPAHRSAVRVVRGIIVGEAWEGCGGRCCCGGGGSCVGAGRAL